MTFGEFRDYLNTSAGTGVLEQQIVLSENLYPDGEEHTPLKFVDNGLGNAAFEYDHEADLDSFWK